MEEALVFAVGVAISPVPIASMTLVLGGPRPTSVGTSFALGWVLGIASTAAALAVLVSQAELADEQPTWLALPQVALGLAFLAAAVVVWRRRGRHEAGESPRWLTALDRISPARSASLGAVLSGVNPKNLALALGAAIAVAEADLGSIATAWAVALFAAIGAAGVVLPLVVYLAAPERSRRLLARFRTWIVRYDAVVLVLVGLVIGTKFLYDGITAL